MHTCLHRQGPEEDITYCVLSLMESGARPASPRNPPVYPDHCIGITGVCHYTWLFIWVLGTELKSFILAQQALLPTEASLQSPSMDFY